MKLGEISINFDIENDENIKYAEKMNNIFKVLDGEITFGSVGFSVNDNADIFFDQFEVNPIKCQESPSNNKM